jgi:hypothetical protein
VTSREGRAWDGTRILFVHIPKTGGLSLYKALVRWAGPRRSYRYARGGAAQIEEFRNRPQAELDQLRLLSGHLPWPVFRERCDDGWLPITVVRDPVERQLSAYSYILGWEKHPLHETVKDWSLREFVEWQVRERGTNSECWLVSGYRTASEARRALEARGFLAVAIDDLPRLAAVLSKRLDTPLELTRENTTQKRLRRGDVDPETIKYISDVYSEDSLLVAGLAERPLLTGRPSLRARLSNLRPALSLVRGS